MIATPCGSGKLDSLYVESLIETIIWGATNGVEIDFILEKFNADISAARDSLVAKFLASPATHLLMIDDDMAWGVDAVKAVVDAKADMAAVAGPKKSYPIKYAVDYADGEPTDIGSAFVLFSRKMLTQMCDYYSDLGYDMDGESRVGLYMPMIMGRRRFAEDYAFCRRWRKLSGKIHVCQGIVLRHVGSHTYMGRFELP